MSDTAQEAQVTFPASHLRGVVGGVVLAVEIMANQN
jgi:hypothetical protein